jgi:CspA family cold shock protein
MVRGRFAMSVAYVRSYAVRTANELRESGYASDRLLTSVTTTSRPVVEKVGIFRRSVTRFVPDKPIEAYLYGWRLWSQTLTETEIWSDGYAHGWSDETQTWLATDGRLLSVKLQVRRWDLSESGRPASPDHVESVGDATDSDITSADLEFAPYPETPKRDMLRNGRIKPGYYESRVKRNMKVPPLPGGKRISDALTELRKVAGTYNKDDAGSSAQGTVKWFSAGKGFGFLVPDGGGPDIFVHYSAIAGRGFRSLTENQRVEFEVRQGGKGPQAENVRDI